MDPFHGDNPQEAREFYNALRDGMMEKARYHSGNVKSFRETPHEWDRQMAYRDPQMMKNYMHTTGRYAETTQAALNRYHHEQGFMDQLPGLPTDMPGLPSVGWSGGLPSVGGSLPGLPVTSSGLPSIGGLPGVMKYRGSGQSHNWQGFDWMRQVYNEASQEQKNKMNKIMQAYNVRF